MKQKKTLSERLTAKYQLVIRNEENLAEKSTIGFTYAKILIVLVSAFIILFSSSLFLSKTLLSKWFDPKHEQMEQNKKLLSLALKVDSLAIEVDRKDKFILNFQRILSGDTTNDFTDPSKSFEGSEKPINAGGKIKLNATDSSFRKEFEQYDLSVSLKSNRDLEQTFFFTPITGFVSDKYNQKKNHYGLDIVTKANEPVKCIADGTVVLASWTQDAGYVIVVQHSGNLLSVYKHNAELYKKVGNFVNAGDIVSIVGNSGEMTDGPHLHFELWYNGNALNPEEFVTF